MKKVLIFTNQVLYRYHNALAAVGVKPTISDKLTNLASFDGLLLPGGEDIDPSLYGQSNIASRGIDSKLDTRSIEVFLYFLSHDKPVLGICKGLQVINVALGGTLLQDIPFHLCTQSVDAHKVITQTKNLLSSLYPNEFFVNSIHHQAVDTLGKDLFITYLSQDGIIEGIQHKDKSVFAVQWHPERLANGEKLFEAFNKQLF